MIKICLKLQNMETKQMEVLAVFDEKNYDDTTKVYEKYNVRGVIFHPGKIAIRTTLHGNLSGMERLPCSVVRMANIRCPAAGWKRERVF